MCSWCFSSDLNKYGDPIYPEQEKSSPEKIKSLFDDAKIEKKKQKQIEKVKKLAIEFGLIVDEKMLCCSVIQNEMCVFLKNLDDKEIQVFKVDYEELVKSYGIAWKNFGDTAALTIGGSGVGLMAGAGILSIITLNPAPLAIGVAITGGIGAGASAGGGLGYLKVRKDNLKEQVQKTNEQRYLRIRSKILEIDMQIKSCRKNGFEENVLSLERVKNNFESTRNIFENTVLLKVKKL